MSGSTFASSLGFGATIAGKHYLNTKKDSPQIQRENPEAITSNTISLFVKQQETLQHLEQKRQELEAIIKQAELVANERKRPNTLELSALAEIREDFNQMNEAYFNITESIESLLIPYAEEIDEEITKLGLQLSKTQKDHLLDDLRSHWIVMRIGQLKNMQTQIQHDFQTHEEELNVFADLLTDLREMTPAQLARFAHFARVYDFLHTAMKNSDRFYGPKTRRKAFLTTLEIANKVSTKSEEIA